MEQSRESQITQSHIDGLRELIEVSVTKIVDHPEDVQVDIIPGRYRLIAELHTHVQDVGQVVGKNAAIIASLRTFVAALGGKHGIPMNLDFVTEKDNARKRRSLTNHRKPHNGA